MAEGGRLHPTLTVSNIRNFIPITLELENGKFTSWSKLFKIHCTAFQVLHHILPPATSAEQTASSLSTGADSSAFGAAAKDKKTATDPSLFARIDAIVLQWIYGTISTDLLHTILKSNSTAASAWARLQNIFQDNKRSRAVYLESQFHQLMLEKFPSISAYCQEIKNISDQLVNIEAVVFEDRLVLQLISGLSESYDTVATLLQQTSPLPTFYEVRSRLILEETRKSRHTSHVASPTSALVTAESDDSNSTQEQKTTQQSPRQQATERPRQQPNGRRQQACGRGQRGRGCGGGPAQFQSQRWAHPPPWAYPAWAQQPWAFPPRPNPTSGLLGPRPQALTAHSLHYAPTNIEAAMQAMTLHNPDTQWYMDTGASSHMTSTSGQTDRDTHSQM